MNRLGVPEGSNITVRQATDGLCLLLNTDVGELIADLRKVQEENRQLRHQLRLSVEPES
jgi:hypothetical protein